eukprot:TRINITY_DN13733_c0_g1_i1.p2 TRINITY_DN13733_c0_g1~~TRINITY_DN13733_c0_g1_i1.p2  ORF type:complete len:143 (+),score=0.96 TRINITY_DN13733_c0_g1_i1:775-1203(+)
MLPSESSETKRFVLFPELGEIIKRRIGETTWLSDFIGNDSEGPLREPSLTFPEKRCNRFAGDKQSKELSFGGLVFLVILSAAEKNVAELVREWLALTACFVRLISRFFFFNSSAASSSSFFDLITCTQASQHSMHILSLIHI